MRLRFRRYRNCNTAFRASAARKFELSIPPRWAVRFFCTRLESRVNKRPSRRRRQTDTTQFGFFLIRSNHIFASRVASLPLVGPHHRASRLGPAGHPHLAPHCSRWWLLSPTPRTSPVRASSQITPPPPRVCSSWSASSCRSPTPNAGRPHPPRASSGLGIAAHRPLPSLSSLPHSPTPILDISPTGSHYEHSGDECTHMGLTKCYNKEIKMPVYAIFDIHTHE